MIEDIILAIRFVYFSLEKEKNIYFEKHNLTASQGDVLLFLGGAMYHKKEVNQRTIEEHFKLTNPTVTGLLKRLEEKAFIERITSLSDARNKIIHLTDQSLNILQDFQKHKVHIQDKIFKDMSATDKEEVLRHLNQILKNLNEEQPVCHEDRDRRKSND